MSADYVEAFRDITLRERSALQYHRRKRMNRFLLTPPDKYGHRDVVENLRVAYQCIGDNTIAVLRNGPYIFIGDTWRNPRDEENENRARHIALLRASQSTAMLAFWDEQSTTEVKRDLASGELALGETLQMQFNDDDFVDSVR